MGFLMTVYDNSLAVKVYACFTFAYSEHEVLLSLVGQLTY